MSRDKLLKFSSVLQDHVLSSWFQQPEWEVFKTLHGLIEAIFSYALYLNVRCKIMKKHHASTVPAFLMLLM